jgi:hypothetical protein
MLTAMGVPQVITTLTKKYARLLGDYEIAEQEIEPVVGLDAILAATARIDQRKAEITETLAALEIVIWLFDPNWDPARVNPRHTRPHIRKNGEISRTAYAVMRDAGRSMSGREIAKKVAEKFEIQLPNERELARIESSILNVFTMRIGETVELHEGSPRRWSLKAKHRPTGRLNSRGPAAPKSTEPREDQ